MRNTVNAVVYSPIYDDGIGTIYADVVNSYTLNPCEIVLDIATNVTAAATGEGLTFSTAGADYDKYDWQQLPMTVLSVENGSIASISNGVEILKLDATEGGTAHYFRIRTQLNYYGTIRFRIRRISSSSGEADKAGLIALDNIIASYPPMTIRFERYGEDYDDSLKGAEVLGCLGDFNVPFQSVGQDGVQARINFSWVTNNPNISQKIEVSNPKFHYRWRYLKQVVPEWSTLDFSPSEPSYLVDSSATQLVTTVDHTLNQGVGDLEYFFTADLEAQYYSVRDYANDTFVGFGAGWTEKISAVTNRAAYTAADSVPTGGTDYFVRIREGESNMEWVQLVGSLVYTTNRPYQTPEVVTNSISERMTLMGDHAWRYHYQIPTNAIGGTLSFKIVAKEHYTNETDAATWLIRTNELFTVEKTVTSIPYTATLHNGSDGSETNEISVVLDNSSTHLKIEYNDEQRAFSLSHASYQAFNNWTDAREGFRGNVMHDGVSNSGVSGDKKQYVAPFDNTWEICPETTTLWHEEFTGTKGVAVNTWFSKEVETVNGWKAQNGMYVWGARGASNYALSLDGNGAGSLVFGNKEGQKSSDLPLGLDSVRFSARIAQPVQYDDFAYYMDGLSYKNYAISAKVTMSLDYEDTTSSSRHYPKDISPVNPSISLIGYHRGTQGCYEFRMTRTGDNEVTLGIYKWTLSGSQMKAELLDNKQVKYTGILMSKKSNEVNNWTTVYFLVYTMNNGHVRLEGHLAPNPTATRINTDISNMRTSNIWCVDETPGTMLKRGGSFGVGSTDCRAGFGDLQIHNVTTAPTDTSDAIINVSESEPDYQPIKQAYLDRENGDESDVRNASWEYLPERWEVDKKSLTPHMNRGCLLAVVPSNQTVQVWLSDAEGLADNFKYSGYEVSVNSFTTNYFTLSPKMPGLWKLKLRTKEEEDAGVVLDDVSITPWEGVETWIGNGGGRSAAAGNDVRDFNDKWVYTKGWITGSGASRECTFQPMRGRADYPMGLRTPYIDQGMSLFSYSYKNADSNCVMLVQIATNMAPRVKADYVGDVTERFEPKYGDSHYVWTTIATNKFSDLTASQRASGTFTTFISLRQHWIKDYSSEYYTNVCGVIRVIVDPNVVSNVARYIDKTGPDSAPMVADPETRSSTALINYGKITLTGAYCYNEPALNLRSWFGWNVHTEGWDGSGNAGEYAYLTDWPDGLSITLNFSALESENRNTYTDAKRIGLGEPTKENEYRGQNPFVQCAAITNDTGIGSVSFRARLFDTNKTSAVITLYGSEDAAADQPSTGSAIWKPITNFVVTTPTYQAFEWTFKGAQSDYHAIRLEAAGARWGRKPGSAPAPYIDPNDKEVGDWEWGDLTDSTYGASVQEPINRVCIDEVSVGELIRPRLKFLDVRPFREHLGSEEICVITNIMTANQQPLIEESWGIQCRVEPQQMADELDMDSIRVWMEVYRGRTPWGYKNWVSNKVDNVTRFSSELKRVSTSNLVFRSYYMIPGSIMKPEMTPNTVYQYAVRATYRDKSGSEVEYPAELDAKDWVKPEWYRGSDVGKDNDSGISELFSAFTILDSISPYRAWINELNLCDAMDLQGLHQFVELAVPKHANLKGWRIQFTDYNRKSASLASIGIDDGVKGITSKTGNNPGVDNTNDYTFVSVCSPSASGAMKSKSDGTWKTVTTNTLINGVFQYQYPYGIQLLRPSGIVEHEVVVEGTNRYAHVSGAGRSGPDLVEGLKASDAGSTWFFVGQDLVDQNYEGGSSTGVWRSHGEEADPSNWTNAMVRTPGEINRLRDGTLQEIPEGYFLLPHGGNVWIYSTLLNPQYMTQSYGGFELSPSAVIVVQEGTTTNIEVTVTNWYQIGTCTTNETPVEGAWGSTGTYKLYFGPVSNETIRIEIDAVPQTSLAETWGLTPENRYTPAVLDWLLAKYSDYQPEDLSAAQHRNLGFGYVGDLTLTEMYWLNIPPVHKPPISGGSNIWFVASMGMSPLISGTFYPVQLPYEKNLSGGLKITNIFTTVTMMITNTVTGAANPPDRLNGLVYDGEGSLNYTGRQAWTSVVFSITAALQKPDVRTRFLPLQQYVFTPDSFGAKGSAHPFLTRIDVLDPFSSTSMGYYYDWPQYRFIYPQLQWKFTIEDNPDGRGSIVPLKANWTPAP